MKRFLYASAGLALSIALVGCGKNGVEGDSATLSQADLATLDEINASIILDRNLTTAEKSALASDWRRMKTLTPNSAASTSYSGSLGTAVDNAYASLFGSKSATVIDYIKTRLKYFGSVETDFGFGRPDKNTVAVNYSIFYWVDGMLSAANPASPSPIGTPEGRNLTNDSARVGIIQFGEYFSDSTDGLFRIGTVAHEARHSDCPSGISAAQLGQIRNDTSNFFDYIGNCAFPHAKCPAGHQLAGIAACDSGDGWGAYSVEVAFFGRVYDQCSTGKIACTESEVQAALASLNDNLNRIIKKSQMMNNTLGLPVMTHQGYTH